MFVRSLTDVEGTASHVSGDAFESRRIVVASDDIGYSLHDTLVKAGSVQRLHYKHHIEANYCFEGEGEVEDVKTGQVYPIRAGTAYVLDAHDEHILRARTDMRFVCIFTPALQGTETHDSDGAYSKS